MIIDYRAYTLHSGTVSAFMELFENEGLEPQVRICGNFLGLYPLRWATSIRSS